MTTLPPPLDWDRDSAGWPHAAHSRFVEAGGVRFHVQLVGEGPTVVLVHGTAASTHSWRDLVAPLARGRRVVAMDLPGHGFSSPPATAAGWSLPGMAAAVAELLDRLGVETDVAVGHSAGAAILVEAALAHRIKPRAIIGLNAALLPFRGVGRHVFPALARVMFRNPVIPALFAWRGRNPAAVADLLTGTGAHLTPEGLAYYQRLMASSGHVGAALNMMAAWDLTRLERGLPRLDVPLVLVTSRGDLAVPAEEAWRVRDLAPGTLVRSFDGSGHLVHEEHPAAMAALLVALMEAPLAPASQPSSAPPSDTPVRAQVR